MFVRIEELERIIRFLEVEIHEASPHSRIRKGHIESFVRDTAEVVGRVEGGNGSVPLQNYRLDTLEADLKRIYQRFVKFQENNA